MRFEENDILWLIASLVDRSFGAWGTAQSRMLILGVQLGNDLGNRSCRQTAGTRLRHADAHLAAKDQDFLMVGGLLPLQQPQTIAHDLAGAGVLARSHLALDEIGELVGQAIGQFSHTPCSERVPRTATLSRCHPVCERARFSIMRRGRKSRWPSNRC